jgi:asparagine synthase (glutamine-hydrolysing)
MCGICGIYNYLLDLPIDKSLLNKMVQSMIHRGPDDEGFYFGPRIGLGMRRLSIIDLVSGQQPIHNEDLTIWIVFNGEIYNFRELRRELEAKGHRFYTRSDTEVIVHGYEEWGDDCLLRLNGIFGLSLWDSRQERLLLARDHFGVKPLYYFDDGHRLLWGSEVKAILAAPDVSRKVNLEALDLFLTFRFVPSPHTMFQGIGKLPPGHLLVVDSRGSRMERYWRPKAPLVDQARSEGEVIALLQEKLESAVQRQMVSDVPIGALLSGGIDSGVIVALMTKCTDHPVRTFTIGFKDGGNTNELEAARKTAELFGTEHHEMVIDSLDYREWLEKSVWHLEEPIATTSALAMFFLCQLVRQHVKVVLTGQGADEPLAGYHRHLAERYGYLYRLLPARLRERLLRPVVEALPRQERLKRLVRCLGISDSGQRFAQEYAVFSAGMVKGLWRHEFRPHHDHLQAVALINSWRQGLGELHPLEQMTYVDARLSLADDLLLYGDKMSMAHSVEARVPFLDLEFAAVAEALPAKFRIKGFTRKYIHKKAIAKWLPTEILQRPKLGFETPVDAWFRSELAGYVRQTLLARDSACNNYFRPEALDSLLTDHISGRQDNRRQLFSLLVFNLWHKQFIG